MKMMTRKVRGASRSRMVWLGLIVTVLGFLESQYRLIENLIPEKYRGLGLITIGLLVVILRFMTTLPLQELGEQPEPEPGQEPPAP